MGPQMSSNAVPATTDSPVTTGQPISPSLQGGQTVVTPSGLTLSVVRQVDQGKRGVVFQVKDLNSGTLYALKVARDSEPETLASIAGESGKKATLAQLGLPHAAMIEQSETFVVTEWIEGTRGDQWVDAWLKSGAPADSPEALALRALIDASVQQRAYVGDLNPKNVIVQAQAPNQPARWVIIDSGSIRTDLTQPEIIERYHANIVRRWSQKIPQAEKPLRGLLGE
jgi:hypothetical protein